MDDADDRLARVRKLAGLMLGTTVRSVDPHPGHGMEVLLDRPASARPVPDRVQGELRLRVLTHAWRLDSAERVVVATGDPPAEVEAALAALVGRTVSGLAIEPPGLDTTIGFGDLNLRVFPVSTRPLPDGDPAWTLRAPNGVSLVVGPGNRWGMAGRRPKTQEAAQ